MSVIVTIDDKSGFCFGVTTAINKAEKELAKAGSLYCLGDIVHNSKEVERLESQGLRTITHDELSKLHNVTVLLRAHGEPPSTYELARKNSIEIIDATCPVVLKLQKRVKEMYKSSPSTQIVIYGQVGHAEVNGLVGQTDGKAIVVESEDDLNCIDFHKDIALFSQTTKSVEGFNRLKEAIISRLKDGAKLASFDSICRSVAGRVSHLREFASNHDLIIFVAGEKSSNGKILFKHCLEVNGNTYMIADVSQLDPQWLVKVKSIGICGATSTPRYIMDQVRRKIESWL